MVAQWSRASVVRLRVPAPGLERVRVSGRDEGKIERDNAFM